MKLTPCLNKKYSERLKRDVYCRKYKIKGKAMCNLCESQIQEPQRILMNCADCGAELYRPAKVLNPKCEECIRLRARTVQRQRYIFTVPNAKTRPNRKRRYFACNWYKSLVIDLLL